MLKCAQVGINYLKTQSTLLSTQTNLVQQSRNTFILKRRYPVPLHKKNERRARLKHKHFIYDLVENTNVRRQPVIDVILLEPIKRVGDRGQKITMNGQRAYETLILPKLAVYATPENLEKYLIEDIEEKKKLCAFSSEFVERTMESMSCLCLEIYMSMDVPWTIEKWHVRASFRKAGFIVPDDAITLPAKTISGPDLTIENKEFYVTVKINNHEQVLVRCKVLHHTYDPERKIKYEVPLHELPNIAIFPEDQEILDSLPKHNSLEDE
ncbi:mitochondrial ribosomal protein L9 [Xylocopa sonorina]|uniref:mitochondrial ribosomal protein L9 n=1 Tax=Xylocopa sonorina TaxID=1818115 RepID=UPI00403AB5E2